MQMGNVFLVIDPLERRGSGFVSWALRGGDGPGGGTLST